MGTWAVTMRVDATVTFEVDADTEDEARDKAISSVPHPRLCHQCGKELDVGDILDIVDAVEMTPKTLQTELNYKTPNGWADGLPAFIADTVFDVRLKDGQQRQCQRAFGFGESNLYFTDCTHPMQNAYCADSLIDAWRVSPNAEITGLAPGKENDK